MISIIIPTLNEESVIENTLMHLKKCSAFEYEIIISDGGSADKTIEIVKQFTNKIIEHEKTFKQTIAMARNAGAKMAKYPYLLFLDADMSIFDPNTFFAKAVDFFDKDNKLVALTASLKVVKDKEAISDLIIFKMVNWTHFLMNNILHWGSASGEFQMIKRESFKMVGGYNEKLAVCEDNEMFERLAKIGHTQIALDLIAYHTGRRAHKIGWPRLLYEWFINSLSVKLFKKSSSKEWKPIR